MPNSRRFSTWVSQALVCFALLLVSLFGVSQLQAQVEPVAVGTQVRPIPILETPVLNVNTNDLQANYSSEYMHPDCYVIEVVDVNTSLLVDTITQCISGSTPEESKVFITTSKNYPPGDYQARIQITDGWGRTSPWSNWTNFTTSNPPPIISPTPTPTPTPNPGDGTDPSVYHAPTPNFSLHDVNNCQLTFTIQGQYPLSACFDFEIKDLTRNTSFLLQRCIPGTGYENPNQDWSTAVALDAGRYQIRARGEVTDRHATSPWSSWQDFQVGLNNAQGGSCQAQPPLPPVIIEPEPEEPGGPRPPVVTCPGPSPICQLPNPRPGEDGTIIIEGPTYGFICIEIFIERTGESAGEGDVYDGYRLMKCFCEDEIINDHWQVEYQLPNGNYTVSIRGVDEDGRPTSVKFGDRDFAITNSSLDMVVGEVERVPTSWWDLFLNPFMMVNLLLLIPLIGLLWWLIWFLFFRQRVQVVDYDLDLDGQKSGLEGAMVKAINLQNQTIAAQAITNKKGYAKFKIPAGQYRLTADYRQYQLLSQAELAKNDQGRSKFYTSDQTIDLKRTKKLRLKFPLRNHQLGS